MFNNSSTVAYLNAKEESTFLAGVQSLNNPKYYLLALIMVDCGLRVSEAISLRVKDFNFAKPSLKVNSLKKRKETAAVELPMTKRIVLAAAEFWAHVKKKPAENEYMFKAGNGAEGKHIRRETVFEAFKKFGVNPHKLRHTCATKLIESGTSLLVVKDILRHSDSRITEVYIHTSEARKQAAINSLERSTLYERVRERLFPSRAVHVLPVSIGTNKFHVGREVEFKKLAELADKKVNTLLLGSQGTGKSHILDNFKCEKMMRIDDTKDFKKVLANMVLHLCQGDKADIAQLLELDSRPECITKLSVKSSMILLTQLTEPQEYTLIIDDVTNLTKANVPTLEALRSHFHVVAAAREIPISLTSWLTNFEKLRIDNLNRPESMKLIQLQSDDFKNKIEDITAFQTAVYSATNGNPLAIVEMVQRWRVEGYVRADSIQAITHTSARSERSIMPFVLIGLACVVVVKFIAKEGDESNKEMYGILGSIALVALMLFTRLGSSIKTRFVR